MRMHRWVMATAFVALFAGSARAQDFGVLESAETIDKGNFKLLAYPLLVLDKDDRDDGGLGVVLRGGYGFSANLDVEVKVAFFDGGTIVGADVEFWLIKGGSLDLSLSAGGHLGLASDEGSDSKGLDLTVLASTHLNDSIELFAGLDVALDKFSDIPEPFDDSFTSLHIPLGIEYKLGEDLDLVAEFGLALNDDSNHYLGGGIAYYLR